MTFTVIPVPGHGAEDVGVAPPAPTRVRSSPAPRTARSSGLAGRRRVDRIADTGGRPLGIEYARTAGCWSATPPADCSGSIPPPGRSDLIAESVDGVRMRFCNNAAIAADGTIWFSDSSQQFGIERWKDDFIRDTRTGRLLRRDPDGAVESVLTGLAFANGVALAGDESFVCVAESGARTVVRHWLAAPRKGMRDKLCSDLPGYPDNIARGSDGLIWVTVGSPTDPLVERIQRGPMALRKVVTKIPEALQPKPKQIVWVQAYDETGLLVHDLKVDAADHGASFHMVTGVREHAGRVWLGSLEEPSIAVLTI